MRERDPSRTSESNVLRHFASDATGVHGLREQGERVGSERIKLKYFKFDLKFDFYLPFSIRTAEERTNRLSAFAFLQNAQVTTGIIL